MLGRASPSSPRQPQPSHPQARQDGSYVQHSPYPRLDTRDKSSLDIPQRIEQKLAEYNASQSILKRWAFEIISWTTSAICIGVIVGICVYTKDEPLSKWPLALTVSNVLSKIASAALILPISEALGQLKWTWFCGSKSQEPIDFEIFDKASRGAWGSFLLLIRTKGRSLAALGAILTLLLLAIDTFFQQVIDLPERWALQGSGEIPRVVRYAGDNGDIFEDGITSSLEDISLQQTTLRFFYYNGNQPIAVGNGTRPEIPLSCPSSRCEWDTYESLGVCSSCTDISQLLTYDCLSTRLDWLSSVKMNETTQPIGTACGYWLNATSDRPMLMSGFRVDAATNSSGSGEALTLRTLPLNAPIISINPFIQTPRFGGSINYKDVYFPFLDALIVSAADGTAGSVYRRERPVAQECMLAWCVKTFKSSYAWGSYEETVTQTYLNMSGKQHPYPWEITPLDDLDQETFFTSFRDNITIHSPAKDSTNLDYGVSNETFARTQALFDEIFPSSITVANATAAPWWRIRIYAWSRNQLRPITASCPWLAPNNVTQYMERLAVSMTNDIRSHTSHQFTQGRAYAQTTFITVHWGWLVFPFALLCLSLVFLVATMVKTSKGTYGEMGMWKTSAMPALIYSLPKEAQKELVSHHAWRSGSKSGSEKIKIRLHAKQGWRVSGQPCTSPTLLARSDHPPPPGWV